MPEQESSIKNQSKARTTQAGPASSTASRAAGGAAKAKPAASKTKVASAGGSRRTGGDLAERIRQRAYEIWEREGRPEGREQAHWEQAEREVANARPARQRAVAA
jgi:hypothetical protein